MNKDRKQIKQKKVYSKSNEMMSWIGSVMLLLFSLALLLTACETTTPTDSNVNTTEKNQLLKQI